MSTIDEDFTALLAENERLRVDRNQLLDEVTALRRRAPVLMGDAAVIKHARSLEEKNERLRAAIWTRPCSCLEYYSPLEP